MNGKTLLAEAIEMKDEIVENRRAIHRAPEVGAHLPQTVQFVEEKLRLLGYEPRELGGGVVAELTGEDMGRCILLRADMDALKVKEKTDLPFRSENGSMHACGHDMHAAMLLGAARLLKAHQSELKGTVKLVFQPDEEGFTGAKAMLKAGVLEAPEPQAAMALHVNSGTPSGLVLCGKGTFMAGCTLFRITVKGVGCHGAMPETGVDPINIAAHIYLALQEITARELPAKTPAIVTMGKFSAGHPAGGRDRGHDPHVRPRRDRADPAPHRRDHGRDGQGLPRQCERRRARERAAAQKRRGADRADGTLRRNAVRREERLPPA